MPLPEVRIDVHPTAGLLHLEVAGVDVTEAVTGVMVTVVPGQAPQVDLQLRAHVVGLEAVPGVVTVDHDADQRENVAEFLAAVDPAEFDRLVLEGLGWGDGGSPAVAALEVLRKMVADADRP